MNEKSHIEYINIAELVDHYNLDVTTAELHGIITGSICTAKLNPVEDSWIKLLVPYQPLDDHQLGHLTDSLKIIYNLTAHALEGDGFEFVPSLPDEDASSEFRTTELAAWCRGFIMAYQQYNKDNNNLSDDSLEAIADLAEIAYVETSDGEEDEDENEQALAELEEYIRISVQMIFDDLNPVTTLH